MEQTSRDAEASGKNEVNLPTLPMFCLILCKVLM